MAMEELPGIVGSIENDIRSTIAAIDVAPEILTTTHEHALRKDMRYRHFPDLNSKHIERVETSIKHLMGHHVLSPHLLPVLDKLRSTASRDDLHTGNGLHEAAHEVVRSLVTLQTALRWRKIKLFPDTLFTRKEMRVQCSSEEFFARLFRALTE